MSFCSHFLLLVISLGTVVVHNGVDGTICCAPDQWEGHMYLDYMQIFIDSNTLYLYFNGSVNVSYDYTNSRAFYTIVGTEISPLIPKPEPLNKTYIFDYKKNMQYAIDSDGSCEKSKIDQNMTRQCVQDSGILKSSGKVGDNIITDTYILTLSESFNNVRGTIQRDSCLPVHMVYLVGSDNPDSGSVFSLDVLSTVPRIKNPAIFTPPSSCLKTSRKQSNSKTSQQLETVLTEIFQKRMLYG
ncbi:ependymin-related protein 1-like [Mytilus galloprovincialis]|uniref:ependymin-related protein 1-like n=1 Tax=Mytilus galloprovincialis TaxID=29158 RepID=UPI003F7CB4F9